MMRSLEVALKLITIFDVNKCPNSYWMMRIH